MAKVFVELEARMHTIGATTRTTDHTDVPHSSCMGPKEVYDYWSGYSGPVCITGERIML
jgi:hypothetical protein